MKPRDRRHTVRLAAGDVRALTVIRRGRRTSIVIDDQPGAPPLIRAVLDESERRKFARAIGKH